MNHNDERDYAEEAANRALIMSEREGEQDEVDNPVEWICVYHINELLRGSDGSDVFTFLGDHNICVSTKSDMCIICTGKTTLPEQYGFVDLNVIDAPADGIGSVFDVNGVFDS